MYSRGGRTPNARHVVAEQRGLGSRQLMPVLAGCHRAFEQRVIDVGDVLHVVDIVTGVQPDPLHQVEGDVRGGVSEVGGVVRSDAAHVQPSRLLLGTWDVWSRSLCREAQVSRPSPGTDGTGGLRPGFHEAVSLSGSAQNGGQGIAGQSGDGCGWRPSIDQPATAFEQVCSTSSFASSSKQLGQLGLRRRWSQRRPRP